MSRNIWITSDSHFGHENIIKYANRPFSSVKEMDEAMIENWNSVVKDNDIVYHLGDVYMGSGNEARKVLSKLKGKKRLILGNHDNGKDQILQNFFQKIMVWRMFPEFKLLLTHVPVHKSSLIRGPFDGDPVPTLMNVHGHIHQNKIPDASYYNACVEHRNYTPINVEQIKMIY